ncbi:hypothetical protein V6N11_034459 [Hibiscus sabdariffa]|uniref:Uncharacterized protein n=1 Tax=Hibiscus sabdariffa TaxID=183260 RepID=A0ABR1ZWG9_9ROSI
MVGGLGSASGECVVVGERTGNVGVALQGDGVVAVMEAQVRMSGDEGRIVAEIEVDEASRSWNDEDGE